MKKHVKRGALGALWFIRRVAKINNQLNKHKLKKEQIIFTELIPFKTFRNGSTDLNVMLSMNEGVSESVSETQVREKLSF